jgi:hypothetical protein
MKVQINDMDSVYHLRYLPDYSNIDGYSIRCGSRKAHGFNIIRKQDCEVLNFDFNQ